MISTAGSLTVFSRYARAEATLSAGFRRMLDTIFASGGITFRAELPSIWVKATVVRTSAFISPPLFLPSRSMIQPKHHMLAKITRYRGVEYRPSVSNIWAAGPSMWALKG